MLERITRRAVFRRFAPPVPRHRSRYLTLIVASRAEGEGEGAGLAMAVGRRVGPAVVRNRLRRQIRSLAVGMDRDHPWSPGWYLVIVHPSARGRSSAELGPALSELLERAGATT